MGLAKEKPKEFRVGPSSSFLTTDLPSSPTPLCTPFPLATTQWLSSPGGFVLVKEFNAPTLPGRTENGKERA